MTDPITPTELPDAAIPAPEEDDVALGAWMGDRPEQPEDGPEPPGDDA